MYSKEEQKELIEKSKYVLKVKFENIKSESEAKKVAKDIISVVNFNDWRYYVLSNPVISDKEYDEIFKLLRKIEEKWPSAVDDDSPTKRISDSLTKEFPKVEHLTPMLSLDNSYNEEDLKEFDKRVRKLLDGEKVEYTVEPKFDGSGISVVYEDDKLVRGATRGDGAFGEDITPNVRTIRSVPLKVNFSKYGIKKAEIRGEVLISKDNFKLLNKDEVLFANPRNAAAGSLRLKDSKKVSERRLDALFYQITIAEDKNGKDILDSELKNQEKVFEILDKLGFKTAVKEVKHFSDIDGVIKYCKQWEKKRDNYEYETDGMVVKVNDFSIREKVGFTAHHPRWAIAFKFQARQAVTKIKEIIFQVGRTGIITPVAKLEPVSLAGVQVSSVSLMNEDFINERDIRIGDDVLVERAGDVIPYVVSVVKDSRTGKEKKTNYPRKCPSCGSEIQRPEGEAAWRCFNAKCPAQTVQKMIHFVSKKGMDVDGLSKAIIKKFYDEKLLTDILSLYKLDYSKIKEMEGFGEKSVENLEKSIEESKNRPTYKLIYSLGIPNVGMTYAKILAKQVKCLSDLSKFSKEELNELPDFGPIIAESVYDFFKNESNIDLIEELEKLGVRTCDELKKTRDKLKGLTFVITGSLKSFGREEVKEKIEDLGGKVTGSVSKKTSYVIVGSEPGSKLDDAKKLGVKTITEEEFLKLI